LRTLILSSSCCGRRGSYSKLANISRMELELEPAEAGFDAGRLARIDRHFERYVEDGRLAGCLAVVARDGRIVHVARAGVRDVASGAPVEDDTVWRIYSMTKPITSVAAMLLYEEGAFELKTPVADFIPAFADARVFRSGSELKPVTDPLLEPVRMWHLLTHTSGLTYGFHYAHPVDAIYRRNGHEWTTPAGLDLAGCCEQWAAMPLKFQPGSAWNYGVSTDVLGRVIEVISGRPFDAFLRERVFEPLGMTDTGFTAGPERLATLYGVGLVPTELGERIKSPPEMLSGGGGLASTAADYHRFTRMLLAEGTPLLGSRTFRYMARNHLPGGADLEEFGTVGFSETPYHGVGFGLGFSVVQDPVKYKVLSSAGELAWGGAASTAFWVDREERITAMFFTQLQPSSTYPLRTTFRQLVYQALA
jgi:CubicO group peptidase (beta-lactamase class C family)